MARKIGVSNRMVSRYENDGAEVTFANALKIHDLFGEEIFNRLNVFTTPVIGSIEVSSDVSVKYASLGFNVLETVKSPFDILSRREDELILTSVGDCANKDALSLAKLLEAENLLVFKKKKPKIETPVIAKEEFLEFEKANELLKFVKEF